MFTLHVPPRPLSEHWDQDTTEHLYTTPLHYKVQDTVKGKILLDFINILCVWCQVSRVILNFQNLRGKESIDLYFSQELDGV